MELLWMLVGRKCSIERVEMTNGTHRLTKNQKILKQDTYKSTKKYKSFIFLLTIKILYNILFFKPVKYELVQK